MKKWVEKFTMNAIADLLPNAHRIFCYDGSLRKFILIFVRDDHLYGGAILIPKRDRRSRQPKTAETSSSTVMLLLSTSGGVICDLFVEGF